MPMTGSNKSLGENQAGGEDDRVWANMVCLETAGSHTCWSGGGREERCSERYQGPGKVGPRSEY